MGRRTLHTVFALAAVLVFCVVAHAEDCFESREDYTRLPVETLESGKSNIKCSKTTGGVLWYEDPFSGTVPMGPMPDTADADYLHEEAVVKPRTPQLMFYPCNNCHFAMAPLPKNNNPRVITNPSYPHEAYAPRDPKDFKHGKGAIWCLDCHSRTNRNVLINHRGEDISFDQPQKLCGKCHGEVYRDWRDGIHGKRTGDLFPGGKKRWWVCTECHNPHSMEPAKFAPLKPEPPPALPRRMKNADHEKHGHGGGEGASHAGKTTHETAPGTTTADKPAH